jgi:hypothetical protein
MKIITNSEAIQETLNFVALAAASESDVAERKRQHEDGRLKTDRHGQATYSVSVKVLEDGQESRDTYVNVRKPSDVPALVPLKPVGEVEINIYSTRSGAITVITVDGFEPAIPARQAPQGQPTRKENN